METADDVIDGFWGTVLERIGNSRTIVAKGYDTQVSKLFKFFNLGVSAKIKKFSLLSTFKKFLIKKRVFGHIWSILAPKHFFFKT